MSKVASLLLSVCLLAASSAAQFSAYDWTFTKVGPAQTMNASVTGPDELTLEILAGPDNGFGAITAEAVATDTGQVTFRLDNTDFGGSGGPGPFCGGTEVSAGNACSFEEWPACIQCFDPVFKATVPASPSGAHWTATWTLDVVEGQCWQIGIAQDFFAFGCVSRLVASELVFVPAPDITLTSIDGTPAYAAKLVTLTGADLELVDQVLIDGVETPILAQSSTEILIRPSAGPSGFADVALRDDTFLLASVPDGLVKWPALRADASSTSLDVTIEAGLPGDAQLVVSLGTMPPLQFGGTFGFLWLDVASSPWFWTPVPLDANGAALVSLPIPQGPGFSGLEVFVQARTPAGFGSPFTAAFSNEVSVELP